MGDEPLPQVRLLRMQPGGAAEPVFSDAPAGVGFPPRWAGLGERGAVHGAVTGSNARARLSHRPPCTAAAPSAPGPQQITGSETVVFTSFTGCHVHGASQAFMLESDLLSALFSAKETLVLELMSHSTGAWLATCAPPAPLHLAPHGPFPALGLDVASAVNIHGIWPFSHLEHLGNTAPCTRLALKTWNKLSVSHLAPPWQTPQSSPQTPHRLR